MRWENGKLHQLVQITNIASGNVVASYSYDAMGRRQTATINGTSASYVYDGLNVVGELNTGSTFLTGLGIDETLAMESPNGTTTPTAQIASYLTDALGSTIRLADANGNKLVDYTYDLYGNTTADAAIYNPFQYTGRENDGVDCLYYYRARYYSPCQQRFISQDPLGLGGGMNPYAYVGGNPLQYRDPLGLKVDLNLFNPGPWGGLYGDIFGRDSNDPYSGAQNYENLPGEFSVGAHGSAAFADDQNFNGISAQNLADLIRQNRNWSSKIKAVRLMACNTGKRPNGYAQDLANKLGVTVYAPNNYVWYSPDGTVVVAGANKGDLSKGIDLSNLGQWVPFYPQH